MVIIDSTVWVDYFNGLHDPETDWLDVRLDVQRLGLTTIIMCEVFRAFATTTSRGGGDRLVNRGPRDVQRGVPVQAAKLSHLAWARADRAKDD